MKKYSINMEAIASLVFIPEEPSTWIWFDKEKDKTFLGLIITSGNPAGYYFIKNKQRYYYDIYPDFESLSKAYDEEFQLKESLVFKRAMVKIALTNANEYVEYFDSNSMALARILQLKTLNKNMIDLI